MAALRTAVAALVIVIVAALAGAPAGVLTGVAGVAFVCLMSEIRMGMLAVNNRGDR